MFDGFFATINFFGTFPVRFKNRPKKAKKGHFLAFASLFLSFVTRFDQKNVTLVVLSKSCTTYKIFSQIE